MKHWNMEQPCAHCNAKPHQLCRTLSGNFSAHPHQARLCCYGHAKGIIKNSAICQKANYQSKGEI